jgi:hypothetical protein
MLQSEHNQNRASAKTKLFESFLATASAQKTKIKSCC